MTRGALVEQVLRQVYGEQPSADASITKNLVNIYVNQGLALAAKQNYKEAIQLDGIGYVNNSFYSTFSGSTIAEDTTDNFQYYITLPQVPLGIGTNEGIASVKFKSEGTTTKTAIPLSIAQQSFSGSMRPVPNKVLYYSEGTLLRIRTTILLNIGFTWTVKVVSGGDSTNMDSTINCPDDYIPVVIAYAVQQLMMERAQPKDTTNDGADIK